MSDAGRREFPSLVVEQDKEGSSVFVGNLSCWGLPSDFFFFFFELPIVIDSGFFFFLDM